MLISQLPQSNNPWLLRDDQKCEAKVVWQNDEHIGVVARWKDHDRLQMNFTHFSHDYFNRRYNNGLGHEFDPTKHKARDRKGKKQDGQVQAVPNA